MKIEIPELSLVLLVGVSGSGKSTFARKHFKSSEIISSDACRGMVCDDENSMDATSDAFELLHYIAEKRMGRRKLTVIDATNVQESARASLLKLAKSQHYMTAAIVLNTPVKICQERNEVRADRNMGSHVIRNQHRSLTKSLKKMKREGIRFLYQLNSPEEVEGAEVVRKPLWTNLQHEHGPFDIIGDIHGCYDELCELLAKLGYEINPDAGDDQAAVSHPEGRRLVFLGDLVDRGPKSPEVLELVHNVVTTGSGWCVAGNHEAKLFKYLIGKQVKMAHGIAETAAQMELRTAGFRDRMAGFIDNLRSHFVLDDGKLVVAHAGLPEHLQGRASGKVRSFALWGETTGETDSFGLPVRYDWAMDYRGKAAMVYGHTPVPEAEWFNNTICLDTGCVFGGKLTAMRYPERELVSVAAHKVHYEPVKPLEDGARGSDLSAQQISDDLLDIRDLQGRRCIETGLRQNVIIDDKFGIAALELLSRFAVNPKWLIYLPPTMSPSETSTQPGLLEHPAEAFDYYRKAGVQRVVCQEKHMGSRAVVVLCRSEAAAVRRFGVENEGRGVVYTRTGRPFFKDSDLERRFLDRLGEAVSAAGVWERFNTDWLCLDAELMPWSLKAKALLEQQYAAVGHAGTRALSAARIALEAAAARGVDTGDLLPAVTEKAAGMDEFIGAYRHYCWPCEDLDDVVLAPFHLLATEGALHTDKNHEWHMTQLAGICEQDPKLLRATDCRSVDLDDPASTAAAVAWWETMTAAGGEGFVCKPLRFVAANKGLLQPAIKCRGSAYLRLIYGPEYKTEENLSRLRKRGLSNKRSRALREFALGIEGLERFLRGEPLRRVHECVYGVLALESQPVDPRL